MGKIPKSTSIIIFEEINQESLSLISHAIRHGDLIYFFSLSESAKKNHFIQKNIQNKKINNIHPGGVDYYLFLRAGVLAHKIADTVFARNISQSFSLKIVKNLFGSTELENMYRKALVTDLQKVIHHQLQITTAVSSSTTTVIFYPNDNYWLYADKSTFFSDNVVVKKIPSYMAAIRRLSKKIGEMVTLAYPLYLLFTKIGIPTFRPAIRKSYLLGINVNLPSILGYNHHYIDFIVEDLYKFPKKDILFVDERYIHELDTSFTDRGYDYYHTLAGRKQLSCVFFFRIVFAAFFPAWIGCTFLAFFEKPLTTRVTRTILSDFIKWNIFCECYALKNHLTILLEDTISKNLILEKNGIETWYVYPDNYTLDYHTGWDERTAVSFNTFMFMKYNHAIVFGDKTRRYLSSQRNSIKKYHCTGVLSSQRIREIKEQKIPSRLPSLIKEKNLTGKIVGVFDTTFVDSGPLKVQHGIKFGKDILRLLEEIPEISIIFKEKKFLHLTPELAPVYKQLEQHPRCLVIRKTENNLVFSTDVIAYSDMVISAAYSSTSAEALGARTRAIYYDVAGTDSGEQFYFNRFPQFVAHNYDELEKLVWYWLFTMSDEKFNRFLDTYVKGEVDPYLDGRAIDRLHQLLRE